MTTLEAARALRVSPQRIRRLLATGGLEGRKVGRDWQVDKASVEHRIKERAER